MFIRRTYWSPLSKKDPSCFFVFKKRVLGERDKERERERDKEKKQTKKANQSKDGAFVA